MAKERGAAQEKVVTLGELLDALAAVLGYLEAVKGIPKTQLDKIKAMRGDCGNLGLELKDLLHTKHNIGNALGNRKDRPAEEQSLWGGKPESGVLGTKRVAC